MLDKRPAKNPFFKNVFFSVRGKIVLLVALLTFLTSALLGTFFFVRVSESTKERQILELEAETDLITPYFMLAFREISDNVRFLSRTPPIQGLVRSINNNGIDPLDGSSTALWLKRLQIIFEEMLQVQDSYVQLRYISIANRGKELVRVNKRHGKIEIVAPENLQHKEQEFYFQEALQLTPEEIYYSDVSLNRENGEIERPLLAVIRTIYPVFDDKGVMFGMVVINAAYKTILQSTLENLPLNKNLYLINENNDHIIYNKDYNSTKFNFSTLNIEIANSPFIRAINDDGRDAGTLTIIHEGKEHIVHYKKQYFNPTNPSQFIITAISVSKEEVMAPVYATQKNVLALIVFLIFLSCVIATLFSIFMTRPLKRMTDEISLFGEDIKVGDLNLPVHLHDEFGALARAFTMLLEKLDVLRQKEKRSFEKLKNIIDNTADGIISIDRAGTIQSFNKACVDIFGYDAGEVIGQNVKMLMPDPYRNEHDQYLHNYNSTGKKKIMGKSREVEGMRKNGEIFPMDLSVSEVGNQGTRIYSGIIRDISERRKAEEEIMRSNEELERFAYIASHDLQEPLRMVRNFTDLLKEEYGDTFEQQASEYMTFISDASGRMQELITDLLEYSRVGREDVGSTEFEVRPQLDHTLQSLKEAINETKAKVTIHNIPDTLYANPIRFSRLMQNLIGNAIKYRAEDRAPDIHINAEERKEDWLFSVSDNGIGIKQEYLEQIFVIFKRLHNKQDYSGTGIGLAVCRKIVESFGGQLWADSKFAQGSTFYFTIPKPIKIRSAA